MENKQYVIGDFASMNKVSARMLRHYDKIGLLRPACVLTNGYRCYSEEQIDTISQIKRLRSCGFLLDEIAGILQNDSPQFLAEQAKRKLGELQSQAAQQQTAILSLRALVQENGTAVSPSIYGVSVSMRSGVNLLTLNRSLAIDDVECAFDDLFHLLHRKKLCTTGCAVLLNRLDCSNEAQNRVGIPLANAYRDECYETISLASASVLSVIHYGDYYNIGHAYSSLLNYVEQHSYSIDDTVMERYFIDSSHSVCPNEYVTEISVILKNTP